MNIIVIWLKQYGGKLTAKWVYGMVIYDGKETKEYSWSKSHFYFIDKPCEKRNPGYPLDSMSIMPECNKYFVDLTEEDKEQNKENYKDDDVIEFYSKQFVVSRNNKISKRREILNLHNSQLIKKMDEKG